MQIRANHTPIASSKVVPKRPPVQLEPQPEIITSPDSLIDVQISDNPKSATPSAGLEKTAQATATGVAQTLLSQTPEPGSQLQTTPLPAFNRRTNPKWSSKLTDIMQHEAPDDRNPYPDLITKGHETTHGINNWLMNNGQPPDGGDGRWHLQIGLYLLDNKSVVIWEPDMKKDKVAAHVPQSLRGSRCKQPGCRHRKGR